MFYCISPSEWSNDKNNYMIQYSFLKKLFTTWNFIVFHLVKKKTFTLSRTKKHLMKYTILSSECYIIQIYNPYFHTYLIWLSFHEKLIVFGHLTINMYTFVNLRKIIENKRPNLYNFYLLTCFNFFKFNWHRINKIAFYFFKYLINLL